MSSRYGVIGCGGSGTNRHMPMVERNPRTQLVAVCDLDKERAESAAASYGATPYTDAREMIESEDLDAVSLTTPPGSHYGVVMNIVETGVDMLVEKPFSTNVENADEMLTACDEHGCTVTEVNNQLFRPIIRRAKRRVTSGEIGEVRTVVTYKARTDIEHFLSGHPDWVRTIDGQAFGENLPHWVYVTRHFLGDVSEVRGVDEVASTDEGPFDLVEMTSYLKGDSGGNGQLTMSFRADCSEFVLIVGSDGTLLVDLEHRVIRSLSTPQGAKEILSDNLSEAVSTVTQTIDRMLTHVKTVALRNLAEQGVTLDEAYESDGHYQQLSELMERSQEEMTVAPSDIRNNVLVYEDVIANIERARPNSD